MKTPTLLDIVASNMREIIRVSPNTYAAFVAATTLNALEKAE